MLVGRQVQEPKLSFGFLMVLFLIAELAACSEDELRLQDLDVVTVELTTSSDQTVPDDARQLGKGGKDVLKLTLSTGTDLRVLVTKHSLNLAVDTYFCADPKVEALALLYVYDSAGIPVLPGYKSVSGVDGTIVFSYIAIAAPERTAVDHAAQLPAYDLKASSEDLCLKLRGGRMIGRHLRSNVVRIDSEAIRSALER